jgi:hypothetical protein
VSTAATPTSNAEPNVPSTYAPSYSARTTAGTTPSPSPSFSRDGEKLEADDGGSAPGATDARAKARWFDDDANDASTLETSGKPVFSSFRAAALACAKTVLVVALFFVSRPAAKPTAPKSITPPSSNPRRIHRGSASTLERVAVRVSRLEAVSSRSDTRNARVERSELESETETPTFLAASRASRAKRREPARPPRLGAERGERYRYGVFVQKALERDRTRSVA